MTALVYSLAESVNARVVRLIAWREEAPRRKYSRWYGLAGLAVVAGFAMSYGEVLVRVHAATEWLVR
jgi:Tfp pilus assembly protein PilN